MKPCLFCSTLVGKEGICDECLRILHLGPYAPHYDAPVKPKRPSRAVNAPLEKALKEKFDAL